MIAVTPVRIRALAKGCNQMVMSLFVLKEGGGLMAKRLAGRPPKYHSSEEIESLIENYFTACEGEMLRDDNGEPILNKWGSPIIINKHPPTVTGLALALGFTSRQALLNYQAKKEFVDTITRAKSRVEQYAEERLFDRDGANGAKFSLTNNFSGWGEKPPSALDEEEQRARIAQMKAQTDKLTGNNQEIEDLKEIEDDIYGGD